MKKPFSSVLAVFGVFFIFGVFYILMDTYDTTAVGRKCASEINKPPELRDNNKIAEEQKNFESCLASMTEWDTIRYGIYPW